VSASVPDQLITTYQLFLWRGLSDANVLVRLHCHVVEGDEAVLNAQREELRAEGDGKVVGCVCVEKSPPQVNSANATTAAG
jgi:hypothetical protein